jgi:hypothetical protein
VPAYYAAAATLFINCVDLANPLRLHTFHEVRRPNQMGSCCHAISLSDSVHTDTSRRLLPTTGCSRLNLQQAVPKPVQQDSTETQAGSHCRAICEVTTHRAEQQTWSLADLATLPKVIHFSRHSASGPVALLGKAHTSFTASGSAVLVLLLLQKLQLLL